MSINPQLSTYIRFFQIISELENESQITPSQKQHLKISFTLKEPSLVNMINMNQDADDEDVKFSIISYLFQNHNSKKSSYIESPCRKTRSQSSVFDLSQLNYKATTQPDEKNDDDELQEIIKQIKKLSDLLNMHQEKLNIEKIGGDDLLVQQLGTLIKLSKQVQSLSQSQLPPNQFRLDEQKLSTEMVFNLKQIYRRTKQNFENYMHSHLMLMDENMSSANLFKLLQAFVFHLVGCENFSFITVKDNKLDIYQTLSDSFSNLELNDQILKEMSDMDFKGVMMWQQINYYPQMSKLFQIDDYDKSYVMKSVSEQGEFYFAFHQQDGDHITKDFLSLANDYYFTDTVQQLMTFLVETVKQARVQFFSPLSIADMIQDIGLAFVRCSKYLLVENVCKLMKQKYPVEKQTHNYYTRKIYDPYKTISKHDSKTQKNAEIVTIDLKDILRVQINIRLMDLTRLQDQAIHTEVEYYKYAKLLQTYEKYQGFIKQCYDKTAFYKFFLRSSDSLIFEFDKKGMLTFLSRPINKDKRESFKINFNTSMIQNKQLNYRKIFQDNQQLITDIETYLQNVKQWRIHNDHHDNPYEVFMKIEEKNFKGFVVIFQETQRWIKNQTIQLQINSKILMNDKFRRSIRKSVLFQETLNDLDRLQQNNPDFKNSTVSMFMPLAKTQQLFHAHSLEGRPRLNSIPKRMVLKNNTFNIPKPKVVLDVQNFQLLEIDNILDEFEFDILNIADSMDKQRLVWAIIKKNNFIEDYNIPSDALSGFLDQLEYKYQMNSNPFHNYDHGITVMQSAHKISLIIQESEFHGMLDQFTKFALVLSALCHDVEHTGRSNMFEINSLSKLAVRYHDKSCLEQHHAATAISILQEEDKNIMINLPEVQFRQFRKMFIQNILSTDLIEHFKMVKQFETHINDKTLGKNEEDIKLLTGFIIHTADFAGGAKQFTVSRQWSKRVNDEFIDQYDEEGKQGYPQQPFMKNLNLTHVMAKSEMGFFKVIVRPLYDLMNQLMMGKLEVCVKNLDETIIEWEKVHYQALQEYELKNQQ